MKTRQTLKRILAFVLVGMLLVGITPLSALDYATFTSVDIYDENQSTIEPLSYSIPTVETLFHPTTNQPTTVELRGNVRLNGGLDILNTGIQWSRNSNMSSATSITKFPPRHHDFPVEVRNLPQGTTIYFRAWATNRLGTGYGAIRNFTTGRTLVLNAGIGANWGTDAPSSWERHSPASGNITAIRRLVAVGATMPTFPTPTNAPTNRRLRAWNPERPSTMPAGTSNWSSTAQWEPITRNVVLNAGTGAHWGETPPSGWVRHAPDSGNITAIRRTNPVAIGATMPTFPTPTNAPAYQTFREWSPARPPTMPAGTGNWSSTAQWTINTRFVILNAGAGSHWGTDAPFGWIAYASTLGNITAIRSENPVTIGAPLPTFPTPTTVPTDYSFNTWIPNQPVAMPAGTGSWSSTWICPSYTRNVILNAGAGEHWGTTPPADWERHAPAWGNITAIRRPVVIGDTMPIFPVPTGWSSGWFPERPTIMPTGTGNWVSTATSMTYPGGLTFTTDDPNPYARSMGVWSIIGMQGRIPLILTNNSNTTKTATISIPFGGVGNTTLWNYTNSTQLAWGDSNRRLTHNVTLDAGQSFTGFVGGYRYVIVIVTWFEGSAIILNLGDFGSWGFTPPLGWERHSSPEGWALLEIRYANPISGGDTMPEFPIPTNIAGSHAFTGWSPVRPATFPHGAESWTSTATWTRIAHHIRLNAGTGAHWGTTAPSGWVSAGSTGGNITSIRSANMVAFGDEMPPFPIPTTVPGNQVFGGWNPPRPATMPSVSAEWSATATWATARSVTIALPDGATWVSQGSLPSGWIRTNDTVIVASVPQGSAWSGNSINWPETTHIATTPPNVNIGIPARPSGNVPANDTNLVAPSRGISLTSGTLEFPAQDEGYSQPAAQSTTITNIGNQPTQQLTVEAPIGFQVSATQTGTFSNNITIASITYTNGTATFYVRPVTSLGAGTHSGNVVVRSTTSQTPILPQQTRPVTFTVNEAPVRSISLSEGTIHFGNVIIPYTLPAAQSTIIENTGNLATQQLTVTSPTGYQVSLSQTTGFASSITVGSIAVGGTATFWTRPNAELPAGSHTGDVTVSNTSAQNPALLQQTRAVSFTVGDAPTRSISLSGGTMDFGVVTIPYTQPAAQSTIIENTGNQSTQQLTVTAPAGYQVSLNQATGFASSITIGSIAVEGTATFWTRPNAELSAGSHTGDVTVRNTSAQSPALQQQARAVTFTVHSEPVNNRNVILNAGSGASWGETPPAGWERHNPESGNITAIRLATPVAVGSAMPTFVPPTTAPMNHNFNEWSPVQPATMPSGVGDWSSTAQWTAIPISALDLTVTPSTTTATIGQEITFTISMGDATNMGEFSFDINLPVGLSYVAGSGSIYPSFTTATGLATVNFDEGVLSLSGFGATAGGYTGPGLTIATFRATALEEGSKNVTLTNLSFDNAISSALMPTDVTPAVVSVSAVRLGHVRGADNISILDVEMAYQAFRGRLTLTENQFLAANVTRTGTLSILDVEMIYQAFRGRHTLS